MWFNKKRSEPLQHLTPEQMIENGEDIATFEDLEGLGDSELARILQLCDVEPADPDACVPCRAYVMLETRQEDHGEEEWRLPSDSLEEYAEPLQKALEEGTDGDVWPSPVARKPVAEQFAEKVEELSLLVAELLQGPPIPPKNVELNELAVLVVAAQKWTAMLDSQLAQGFALSEEQRNLKALVEQVTGRLSANAIHR